MFIVQTKFQEVVQFAKAFEVWNSTEIKFATCSDGPWRYPILRLLIKVHKKEIGARGISSGTRWLSNPYATLLASWLQPVAASITSVLNDTKDFVDNLQSLRLEDGERIWTFDVEQLYPTIDLTILRGCVRDACLRFYQGASKFDITVQIMMDILDAILLNQIVSVARLGVRENKRFFIQTKGVTTGLICAVQLANIFICEIDNMMKTDLNLSIKMYKRFIDDICLVSKTSIEMLLSAFSSWNAKHNHYAR